MSRITVTRHDPDEHVEWNDLLARSPHATPLHLDGALTTLADHSNTRLHRLVAHKGQQPVGLFPVFSQRRGPLTLAFSPPPSQNVDYLGPALLDTDQLKRRKLDKRNLRFVEACLDWVDDELGANYVNVRTSFRYRDPRPFDWNDFAVRTKYTYVLDLEPTKDELFATFSGDARSTIRQVRDSDREVTVEVGDGTDVRRILSQLERRLESTGRKLHLDPEFVVALYDELDDVVRPYVARVDGEYHGGIVTLESNGTVHAWQGGAKTDSDLDLNDYLDWRIIRDAKDRGNDRYDLVGAESQRLCWYKSKFGPDLEPYHIAQRSSRTMDALANLYKRLR